MGLFSKSRGLIQHASVLAIPDILKFRRIRRLGMRGCTDDHVESLRIRSLRNLSVECRPGTTDAEVLWDTFHLKYHLPTISLRTGATIFDLGCNVGYTTAHLASLYPGARVIGVELDQENAMLAQRNTRVFSDRVTIVHGGVWIHDGQLTYGGDEKWGFRIAQVKEPDLHHRMTAPAYNLNTLCDQLKVESVDYMKIDIEGAEAFVLSEHSDWLDRVSCINLEVHAPATFDGCASLLGGRGFSCQKHSTHPFGLIALK